MNSTPSNPVAPSQPKVEPSRQLTARQIQVLRWFDENPSTRSRWLVNGRNPRGGEGFDKWSHMEVSGANGSIVIAAADVKALIPYKSTCPSPDKMWGVNELGRAALSPKPAGETEA